MKTVEWTNELVDRLKQLWREGYSARQITEKLNELFQPAEGDEVTRNAVIGKANRLGLSKPSKSSVTRRKNYEEKTAAEKALELKPPVDEGATIFSLTVSRCRWPIGNPGDLDFHFCGSKATKDRRTNAYCDYHAAIAYQPPKAKGANSKPSEQEGESGFVPETTKGGALTGHLTTS